MPDPTSHAPDMISKTTITLRVIRPNKMADFWWLYPWSYARTLYMAANALRSLSDRQDDALKLQANIIADQSDEIRRLRARVVDLHTTFVEGKPSYDINPKHII